MSAFRQISIGGCTVHVREDAVRVLKAMCSEVREERVMVMAAIIAGGGPVCKQHITRVLLATNHVAGVRRNQARLAYVRAFLGGELLSCIRIAKTGQESLMVGIDRIFDMHIDDVHRTTGLGSIL